MTLEEFKEDLNDYMGEGQYEPPAEPFYVSVCQDATRTVNWNEMPHPIPTQACSNEQIEEANKKWSEFISKHPEYK